MKVRDGVFTRLKRAISITDLLIAAAIIGVLVGLGLPIYSHVRNAAIAARLQSNADTINYTISVILASGESLDGLDKPGEIIEVLKRHRTSSRTATFFAGSPEKMINPRLAVRLMTAREASGKRPRAVWVPDRKKFVIMTSGHGVREFFLDH